MFIIGANNNAIRLHEIFNRRTFFQEFGVGNDGVVNLFLASAEAFSDNAFNHVTGTDWNSRFGNDNFLPVHAISDRLGNSRHVLHISGTVFVRRCTDRDKLDFAVRHRAIHIGGEIQTFGFNIALDDVIKTGFENRHNAFFQIGHLGFINIDAQDIIADVGDQSAGD